MLILSRSEVERLLDVDELIEALAAAMSDLSAGRASTPNRVAAVVDERDALLLAMPGYAPSSGALMAKLVSLFPHNTTVPTHQALIAVFDSATGQPTALLDGEAITALRTAAGSALATRLLAREDATTLAILGTGVQARAHAQAVPRVRAFTEIRVAGRDREEGRGPRRRDRRHRHGLLRGGLRRRGRRLRHDPRRRAGRLREPAVPRHARHVRGLQPHGPRGRRRHRPGRTRRGRVPRLRARAGARRALSTSTIADPDEVVEIGELLDGQREGRTSPDELTLYKSVGVAVQDAAAAMLVLRAALEQGAGLEVDIQD